MKITLPNGTILEMPDTLAPAPQSVVDTSAPVTAAPEPTPKESVAPSMLPAKEPPTQSETISSADGPIYGGASNISDPQANNPKVFQFQMPREE